MKSLRPVLKVIERVHFVFDLIVKRGKIADGSGRASYVSDVGTIGDRIAAIGDLSGAEFKETIEADGLVVSPGFIDIHTHSDVSLLVDPRAESLLHQGVTTEVVGNCGFSAAPVSCPDDLRGGILGNHPSFAVTWTSVDQYLSRLEERRPGTNVAMLVGHGPLRNMTMNRVPRPATQDEVVAMERLLAEALEQGAFGFSTGLEYQPGKESRTDELVGLCRVVARYDGFYATHVRNRDIFYDQSFAEAIAIARNSGARLEISHINPKFGRPEKAMVNTLQMIDWARKDGVKVGLDVMPTNWGHTTLSSVLPSWAFNVSSSELLNLLKSENGRLKLKNDPQPIWQLVLKGEWERIRLFASEANSACIGMTIGEIARSRGHADPYDAAFDLLLEEGIPASGLICIADNFSEDDVRLALTDSQSCITSDTMSLAPDGPYAKTQFSPLAYNCAPHFLQKFIREEKLLTLEEGVRRLTANAAAMIGLNDRGVLRAGAMADITIFNEHSIANISTVRNPNVYPTGVEHVIVNGQVTIKNATRLPVRAGRVLRK